MRLARKKSTALNMNSSFEQMDLCRIDKLGVCQRVGFRRDDVAPIQVQTRSKAV